MSAGLHSKDKSRIMLTTPIPKLVLQMAYPTIIAFMITAIYSLTDTYFVSGLGINATAAVSVNTSLDQVIAMSGSMLGLGANSMIARTLGGGKREKAEQLLSTAFFLAFGFGLLLLLAGLPFLTPLMRFLGATKSCERYSVDYATYVLLAAPFTAASTVMNQCLRSEGSAVRSMLGSGIGGILNCILDPLLITTCSLGVKGASLATALSKFAGFCIFIYPYLTKKTYLRLSLKNFRPKLQTLLQIFNYGSSSMLRGGLAIVAGVVLNNLAGNISDAVLAGVGVANRVLMLPFNVILGFAAGFQPVAGYNWGSRRFDRVRESFRFASTTAFCGAAILGGLLALLAPWVIRLFTKADAEATGIGILCIRLQCAAMPIHAYVAVVDTFCSGLGHAHGARFLATARQGTAFFPVVYPMAYFWGANGVAAAQAAADALTIVLSIPVLHHVRKMIQSAEQQSVHQCLSDPENTSMLNGN